MTKMPISKSQKRLFIILAILAMYAAYDWTTSKPKPVPSNQEASGTSTPAVLEPDIRSDFNERPGMPAAGVMAAEWRRDPFRRFPEMATVSYIGKALQTILMPKLADLELSAISRNGRKSYALINDQILAVGETINGYRVVDIHPTEVVLKKNDFTFTLSLPDEEAYE